MIRAATLALLLLASPAWAMKEPPAVAQDRRIREVAYDPDNVTSLTGSVGATLTLEFPPRERVEDVALSDGRFLQAATKGENLVYLKPMAAIAPQPVFVATRREDGSLKLYTLQFQAAEAAMADSFFLVRFTDPVAERVAAAAAELERERARREREVEDALKAAPPPVVNRDYSIDGRAIGREPPPTRLEESPRERRGDRRWGFERPPRGGDAGPPPLPSAGVY